jgi:hypothetical protein
LPPSWRRFNRLQPTLAKAPPAGPACAAALRRVPLDTCAIAQARLAGRRHDDWSNVKPSLFAERSSAYDEIGAEIRDMAIYHFNLRDGRAGLLDVEGTELPSVDAAKAHATEVARELLKGKELKNWAWRLDVVDGDGAPVFELPFARVDPTLDHLSPDLRQLVERLAESKRSCSETIFSLESLAFGIRAVEARRNGKPYVAARFGRRVDSPSRALGR